MVVTKDPPLDKLELDELRHIKILCDFLPST